MSFSTTVVAQTPAWSYSALKNYETCPKRYYHYNVAKDVREPESEQLLAGNQLHAHFDARVSKGTPLPLGYGHHETLLAKLANAPGKIHTEQKLALTSEFKPSAYFGKSVWFRTVIDYAAVRDNGTATVLDYKTGKPAEDLTQLQLVSATMFHHDVRLQRVKAALVFVNHDQVESAEFVRADLSEIWSEILPRVKLLTQARQTQEYPPKPGGLCRKWCHVTSCHYHGK